MNALDAQLKLIIQLCDENEKPCTIIKIADTLKKCTILYKNYKCISDTIIGQQFVDVWPGEIPPSLNDAYKDCNSTGNDTYVKTNYNNTICDIKFKKLSDQYIICITNDQETQFSCLKSALNQLQKPVAYILIPHNTNNYKNLELIYVNDAFLMYTEDNVLCPCTLSSLKSSLITSDEFIEIYKELMYSTDTYIKYIPEKQINTKTYYKFAFVKMQNKYITILGTDVSSAVNERTLTDKVLSTRNELLGYLSHEIRTPLNGITASIEIMNGTKKIPQELNKYMDILDNCSVTLLTIINDLLDLSRLEAKKLELVYKPFTLQTCVNSAIAIAQISKHTIPIEVIIDPELHRDYIGDSGRIRQIITNFISNAIKFTKKGQIKVSINKVTDEDMKIDTYNNMYRTYENYISSNSSKIKLTTIEFIIKDTGIGIPKNKLSLLFQPFSQLDTGLKKSYNGAGIGLSICKNLVSLMNGSINVESEENVGSIFSFQLRLPEYTQLTQVENYNYDKLIGKSILIVDDNSTNLKFLESTLLKCKMFVMKSTSAIDAIDNYLINAIPFDIIILDICMNNIDGVELANKIRNDYNYACPIFGMSSVNPEMVNDTYFEKIMTKPMNSLEIISTLNNYYVKKPTKLSDSNPLPRRRIENIIHPILTRTKSLSQDAIILKKNFSEYNILLVEDNTINIEVTLEQLSTIGIKHIDVATNGQLGFDSAKNKHYDVILMDISLSGVIDGIEATEKILDHYKFFKNTQRPPRIIALTANTMTDTLNTATNAGMEKILLKPVRIDDLRTALGVASSTKRPGFHPGPT